MVEDHSYIAGGIVVHNCKNREEAESKRVRDKVDEWFTSTAMSRVEPTGSVIVVHQRWHSDDLIGRCLKRGGWEYVNLPAIKNGVPLWPWRWTTEALELKRRDVGEYDWLSQWMGHPQPKGGKLFRLPAAYGRWPDLNGARILIVCDPAATSATRGDHSAIVVGAGKLLPNGLPQVDILEVHRLQVSIPILVGYLLEVQKKWGAPIGVEAVAGFKGVPQSLRAHDKRLRIFDITPTMDKFVRALPAAAAWNDGRIRTPIEAPWLGPYIYEMTEFTGMADVEDDQVDATAHLYNVFDQLLRPGQHAKAGTSVKAPGLPFG